MGKHNTRNNT